MQQIDVIVAGASHNSHVSACHPTKAGLRVLVLEAHQTSCGMTCTNPMAPEAPEHRINEASIHTSMFDELELAKRSDLSQRLIAPCHYLLNSNGEASFGMWRGPHHTASEISHFSRMDAQAWLQMSESADAPCASASRWSATRSQSRDSISAARDTPNTRICSQPGRNTAFILLKDGR
ncbi:hypothetical protein [Pseudomonas sp. NBRC 100443]|uniref:hypothetical protein n=1 Tax=Pseudomonas sp. NBRC 100443 TaxID=1113665 RepID=UPI0024A05C0D|nr:hypothetical protein [Pseudomonas sp. NBRC 100443]GLU39272.1 hypothetical protein Pssp01_33650 [Pseudomonas sp. NBRC 100443]